MYCDKDFYQCKNLLFWDNEILKGYICTITCAKCECEDADMKCLAFAVEAEE